MTRIRVNILMLIIVSYGAMLAVFLRLSMIVDPAAAIEAIESPLIALITGSVAMAQKLLDSESADGQRPVKPPVKPPAAPNKRGAG